MNLTIGFPTGRYKPELPWLLEDLAAQRGRRETAATNARAAAAQRDGDVVELLVVDALERPIEDLAPLDLLRRAVDSWRSVPVLPNPWQGRHRIMDRDWWALGAAKNAVFVYAQHDYVAIVDDRCHLGPRWLSAVRRHARDAILGGAPAAVAGTYTRSHWDDHGTHLRTDVDSRMEYAISQGKVRLDQQRREEQARSDRRHARFDDMPGAPWDDAESPLEDPTWRGVDRAWLYGMVFAMPLELALRVNGHESGCDGVSMEDIIFSCMLTNAGVRIDWDPDLLIHQDRRFSEVGPPYVREDKDRSKSPKDKSHALLDRFAGRKRTELTPDLRELRALAQVGRPMPVPTYDRETLVDWYDGQRIVDYPIGGG